MRHARGGPGGAAVCAGLVKCDADDVLAYLETVTQSTVGLYAALEAALTDEWSMP